jgi:hypothetical protein
MGYRHREVDFDKEANLRAPSSGTQSFWCDSYWVSLKHQIKYWLNSALAVWDDAKPYNGSASGWCQSYGSQNGSAAPLLTDCQSQAMEKMRDTGFFLFSISAKTIMTVCMRVRFWCTNKADK